MHAMGHYYKAAYKHMQFIHCTYVSFVCLKDMAEVSFLLSVDERKDFLVLWIQSAEGYTLNFYSSKVILFDSENMLESVKV